MKKNIFIALLSSTLFFAPVAAFGMCTTYTAPPNFHYDFIQNKLPTRDVGESEITTLYNTMMWGKEVRVARDKKYRTVHYISHYTDDYSADHAYTLKWLYILNKNTCTILYARAQHNSEKIIMKNLWREGAGMVGAPEMIEISPSTSEENTYLLSFIAINKNFDSKNLIPGLWVRSKNIPIIHTNNQKIRINGKKFIVADLKNGRKLLKQKNYGFFLNIGDYGEPSAYREDVARAMASVSREYNGIEKVITNGDNFYAPYGIQSVDDPDYKTNFEDYYVRDWLRVPFLIALGNHDYSDNTLSALFALDKKHTKWYLPAHYYSYTYPMDTSEPLVEFFILDTQMISTQGVGTHRQLEWLDRSLEASTARWKIVVGHHPPYSYGVHGDSIPMQEDVVPILRKYHVDALINGHEHDMQLLNHPDDDIVYVINGTGSETRPTGSGSLTEFAASKHGFVGLKMRKHRLTIFFYDSQGNILHKKKLEK